MKNLLEALHHITNQKIRYHTTKCHITEDTVYHHIQHMTHYALQQTGKSAYELQHAISSSLGIFFILVYTFINTLKYKTKAAN